MPAMMEAPPGDVVLACCSGVPHVECHGALEQRVAAHLLRVNALHARLQAHLLQRRVATWLQQLPHDPVRLLQAPLQH